MKKLFVFILISFFITGLSFSQNANLNSLNNEFTKSGVKPLLTGFNKNLTNYSKNDVFDYQLKKRKTSSMYFGAGYSFVIFTASDVNTAYPVLNISKGEFLSEINLFFGFSIAKAVTIEIEPSILYSSNQRYIQFYSNPPFIKNGNNYSYVFPQSLSLLAFPIVMNVRFFPMYKMTNFARLFFIGGGIGYSWIREEYDNVYTNDPVLYYNTYYFRITEPTSQWQPIFRGMIGFTGAGGQFGFGGELRFNYVPLTVTGEPFVTRFNSKNFNSVDLAIRFYFSL